MNITEDSVSIASLVERFKDLFNKFFLVVLGLLILFALVKAGYMWMIGSENPQQVAKAKSAITWAIIGLVLSSMAVALVNLVSNLLGN